MNFLTFCFKCDIQHEMKWKPYSYQPEPEKFVLNWNDKNWTSAIVDRFLHRLTFPNEDIYQTMEYLGNNYLYQNINRLSILNCSDKTKLCNLKVQELDVLIQSVGLYFFKNPSWNEIFAFLRCIKLMILDKLCCEEGPFLCGVILADSIKTYIEYRLKRWIDYNGGWRVGLNKCKEFKKKEMNSIII